MSSPDPLERRTSPSPPAAGQEVRRSLRTLGTIHQDLKAHIFTITAPNSLAGTVDHDLHRKRRATISGFFSTASIRRLEPIMKADMAKLLQRMREAAATQEVLNFHYVLKACACDIITAYAFGQSFDFLGQEDFATPYIEATDIFHFFNHAMCHFPIVGTALATAPDWLIKAVFPGLTEMWNKKTVRCTPPYG